jgi:anti-sigma factor RsiW
MTVPLQAHPHPQDLYDFAAGKLSGEWFTLVEDHVASCAACARLVAEHRPDALPQPALLLNSGEGVGNREFFPLAPHSGLQTGLDAAFSSHFGGFRSKAPPARQPGGHEPRRTTSGRLRRNGGVPEGRA